MAKAKEVCMAMEDFRREHKRLVKILRKGKTKQLEREAKEQESELAEAQD
jgi:hypothetical protein